MNVGALALVAAGTLVFAAGAATMRQDRDAPKDWRFWTGTVVSTIGLGAARSAHSSCCRVR